MKWCTVSAVLFFCLSALTAHAVTLSIGFAGSGAGSVSSNTSLACTAPCAGTVATGAAVVLLASPDAHSTFTGWSGAGCSGTGACSISANSDTTVVATFESSPPIKNAAVPSSYYRLLSEAVSSAGYGASVQVQSRSIALVERLQVDRGVKLTVKGGYDSAFTTVNGSTVLRGRINITDGKLVANRLSIAPMPPVNRVLLFGDSNTEQLGLESYERWSTLLSQSYPTKTLINVAKGGQTTKGALGAMDAKLWEHRPDLVLVMYGTNDSIRYDYDVVSVPLAQFEANIRTMIAAIRDVGAVPVLLTVIPAIEGTGSDGYYYSRHPAEYYQSVGGAKAWIEQYNSIVRRVASDSGVMLVDIWDRFRQAAGSVADASLIASGLLDRSGTHLTAAGSNLIHQSLLAQQAIEVSSASTEVPVPDPDPQ